MPDEQSRITEAGMSCFYFMRNAKTWEEQRFRELGVTW